MVRELVRTDMEALKDYGVCAIGQGAEDVRRQVDTHDRKRQAVAHQMARPNLAPSECLKDLPKRVRG
jgi:hypothetical protein